MLYAEPPKSTAIYKVEKQGTAWVMYSEKGMHRLCPMNDKVIRITYTERDTFSERDKPGVTCLLYTSDAADD